MNVGGWWGVFYVIWSPHLNLSGFWVFFELLDEKKRDQRLNFSFWHVKFVEVLANS